MKVKKPASKTLGELTGKLVAGAKALPAKTSETTGSIKDEFIAGFQATSGPTKKMGKKSTTEVVED